MFLGVPGLERVGLLGAESEVRMAAPSLGEGEAARHLTDRARHLVHGIEVGVHALTRIEPGFLARVRGQGVTFCGLHFRGIDIGARDNQSAEAVAQSVRHRVIKRHVAGYGGAPGNSPVIGHAADERGGDGKATGIDVILHVVLGRMGQHDVRADVPHRGGESAQEAVFIEDFDVVREAWMPMGAQAPGGFLGLAPANGAGLCGIVLG